MKMLTCESVRDRLPELDAGVLAAEEAVMLEHHIELCPECAGERAAVTLVRAAVPEVPAGLESRIARALVVGGPVAARPRPIPSFAVAAGVAFVLLTGSLLVRNGIGPAAEGRQAVSAELTFGWPPVADPILRAVPVLNDLSVEELESLLAELES